MIRPKMNEAERVRETRLARVWIAFFSGKQNALAALGNIERKAKRTPRKQRLVQSPLTTERK
jgi:hypothetical protein